VKMAARRTLASLFSIGLLLTAPALAQTGRPEKQAMAVESEEIRAPQPAEVVAPQPSASQPAGPRPVMANEGYVFGEEQPYVDGVFGSLPPSPGCEICCAGCLPPCWYTGNDARMLTRSRATKQGITFTQIERDSSGNLLRHYVYVTVPVPGQDPNTQTPPTRVVANQIGRAHV
jgi:hypothetical protein